MSRIRVFIAICSVALGAAGTQAQMPNRQSGFPSQEQFELVRMWKLVETLEIDEGQAAKVFPAFSRHSRQRRALQADHGELLKGLGKSLQDGADDADLLEAIGKIRASSRRVRELEVSFETELSGLLTPRQQARMLLFEGSFRNDLRDVVRRMRMGGGPPGEGARRRWSED